MRHLLSQNKNADLRPPRGLFCAGKGRAGGRGHSCFKEASLPSVLAGTKNETCGIFYQNRADTLGRAREAADAGRPPRPHRERRVFLKRFKTALGLGLLLAIVLTCSFSSFSAVCAEIRRDTLRLHILANSDTEADQQLKLAVRDAILAETGGLFGSAGSKEAAERSVDANLDVIRGIAETVIREQGYDYPVRVTRTNLYFATTRYPDTGLTMPAGRYDAVRVEIGKAQGKNWFCVLFPPLCVPAATADAAQEAAYTEEERAVTGGGYEVRFAVLEWLEQARESLARAVKKPDDAVAADSAPQQTPAPTEGASADGAPQGGRP